MPNCSVVAFDIGILLRFSRLYILQTNVALFRPLNEFAADIFRPVIHPNAIRLSAPFNDLVQAPDHSLRRQRKVDINRQAFSVEVIQYVKEAECATIAQTISHKVH